MFRWTVIILAFLIRSPVFSRNNRATTTRTGTTYDIIREILFYIQKQRNEKSVHSLDRPFIIASFAQSLDGKMAPFDGEGGNITTSNYVLSGVDSLLLTHAIRSEVDAVLIGGKTLSLDNPRLTNRLWNDVRTPRTITKQPRAVILDTNLKHLMKVSNHMRVKNPIICCANNAPSPPRRLRNIEIVRCKSSSDGGLCVKDVLLQLSRRFGIKSVMIEGGPSVLSSFFNADVVDVLCITIAPKFLDRGISPSLKHRKEICIDLSSMQPRFYVLGVDLVVMSRWPTPRNEVETQK